MRTSEDSARPVSASRPRQRALFASIVSRGFPIARSRRTGRPVRSEREVMPKTIPSDIFASAPAHRDFPAISLLPPCQDRSQARGMFGNHGPGTAPVAARDADRAPNSGSAYKSPEDLAPAGTGPTQSTPATRNLPERSVCLDTRYKVWKGPPRYPALSADMLRRGYR